MSILLTLPNEIMVAETLKHTQLEPKKKKHGEDNVEERCTGDGRGS